MHQHNANRAEVPLNNLKVSRQQNIKALDRTSPICLAGVSEAYSRVEHRLMLGLATNLQPTEP